METYLTSLMADRFMRLELAGLRKAALLQQKRRRWWDNGKAASVVLDVREGGQTTNIDMGDGDTLLSKSKQDATALPKGRMTSPTSRSRFWIPSGSRRS